jgi:hypothetical protein
MHGSVVELFSVPFRNTTAEHITGSAAHITCLQQELRQELQQTCMLMQQSCCCLSLSSPEVHAALLEGIPDDGLDIPARSPPAAAAAVSPGPCKDGQAATHCQCKAGRRAWAGAGAGAWAGAGAGAGAGVRVAASVAAGAWVRVAAAAAAGVAAGLAARVVAGTAQLVQQLPPTAARCSSSPTPWWG